MAQTPKWAMELIEKVCSEVGQPMPPIIQWQHSKTGTYSGRAWSGTKIHIRVGSIPRWQQKMVLLHELTHYLLPPPEHHSERFWTLAFLLYRRYGVPPKKALANERRYRQTAVVGYRRSLALIESPRPSSVSG